MVRENPVLESCLILDASNSLESHQPVPGGNNRSCSEDNRLIGRARTVGVHYEFTQPDALEQRMTGEKDSDETKEEYLNKRKGRVGLLEIYHHLHQQGQVSKKIVHTVVFVHLKWSRSLTHSVFVRSARNDDWSARAQETCVLAAGEIRRYQKFGQERITWIQWLFLRFCLTCQMLNRC